MGNDTHTTKPEHETFALANVSPHEGKPDDLENEDVSQLLSGAKAITGKAVWSANGAAAMQREYASQRQKAEDKHEAENREMRELAHLAEWNAQKTNVGGVEMTNEEAQKARQHIIDNEDYYAERAVREGRIGEDEKDDYKNTNRRIHALQDRVGRGNATEDEKRECEHRQRSRMGRITEHDSGEYHSEKYHDQKLAARTELADSHSEFNGNAASAVYGDAFQSAPKITPHFERAVAGLPAVERETVVAPAPKIAATGVNL